MIPKWIAIVIDVEGAFLQGKFINGEQMHIDVPDGMNKYYGNQEVVVLLLNVPIYGTSKLHIVSIRPWSKRLKIGITISPRQIHVCTISKGMVGWL